MISLKDIIKSLSALVNVELPQGSAIDALNMLPAFQGSTGARSSIVMQSSGRGIAIRKDNWKYICTVDHKDKKLLFEEEELYDLSTDESEAHNVVADFSEKVEELRKELEVELFGES